jgi:DNA-binding transcriptional LysR family regulator
LSQCKRHLAATDMSSLPPRVEIRHLRYFLAVSEELHFGRAAERLHIAQPPLSQAIRKLEAELGVLLLERTSRVVSVTPAGAVFAELARKVLAEFEVAVAEARRAGGASAFRIASLPHLPIELLLSFLDALNDRNLAYRPHVTHLPSLEQVRRLRAGELELGVFHDPGETEGLEQEPLFPGELLAAFLAEGHPLAERSILGPEDFRDEVLIVSHEVNPALHDRWLGLIEQAGYRFRSMYDAGGMDGRDVILAVAEGLGTGLEPFSLAEVAGAGGLVVRRRIDPPIRMPDTVVAWRADPPPQLRKVLADVRTVARRLRAEDRHSEGD